MEPVTSGVRPEGLTIRVAILLCGCDEGRFRGTLSKSSASKYFASKSFASKHSASSLRKCPTAPLSIELLRDEARAQKAEHHLNDEPVMLRRDLGAKNRSQENAEKCRTERQD